MGAIAVQWIGIALNTVGTNLGFWIGGVVLNGVASAAVWATTLALIIEQVPRQRMAQSLSLTGMSISLGVFLGPSLSGIIYQRAGHYAVWATVFALTVVDLVLRLFLIEADRPVDSSGSKPSNHLAALRLFHSPEMLTALFGAWMQATILASYDASLTIRVQQIFHWTSQEAGLLYLALCLPAFATPLVGKLADRVGAKPVLAAAFLCSVPGLVCQRFIDTNSLVDKVLLGVLLVLLGAVLGTTVSLFSAEVGHVVHTIAEQQPGIWGERGVYAQAGSLWWIFYTLGLAVGPLVGGFVQEYAGWTTLSWTLAIMSGTTSLPILALIVRQQRRRPETQTQHMSIINSTAGTDEV